MGPMKGLVGGPLLVGGLEPGLPAPTPLNPALEPSRVAVAYVQTEEDSATDCDSLRRPELR